MLLISQPTMQFVNPRLNTPVASGKMYFGEPNTDPKVEENRVDVYYIDLLGNTVILPQPVRLSESGVPIYLDRAIEILSLGAVSIRVDDRNDIEVYLIDSYSGQDGELRNDVTKGTSLIRDVKHVASISALRLLAGQYNGQAVQLLGIEVGTLSGSNLAVWDSASTEADNDYSIFAVTGVAVGRWKIVEQITITPMMFGGIGDEVTLNGAALNAALAFMRDRINSALVPGSSSIFLDLCGKTWVTDQSLNSTGFSSWGWGIGNGTIVGKCSGKAVLDKVGSRGGHLRDLVIYGDQASAPRIGLQVARGAAGGQKGFCDNTIYDNVTVFGYYSLTAGYFYAQETTTYDHCRFWNSNSDGYAAMHIGNDAIAAPESDYEVPVTGGHSYINNKYINCDYRYQPAGNAYTITGITQANGPTVSAPGHTFVDGDTVVIGLIGSGMTQINNFKGTVSGVVAGVSFVLAGVDTTGYTAYTSGGQVVKSQTKPTVYMSRMEQHSFDTCYIVNYGTDGVEVGFPEALDVDMLTLDALFEGAGSRSHVRFLNAVGTRNVNDFVLRTYNTHARENIITSNASGGATVNFKNADISVTNTVYSQPSLFDVPANYKLYDADVYYPRSSGFSPLSCAAFVGKASFADNLKSTIYNHDFVSSLDQTYTPVVTAQSGTITAYTATGRYKKVGNLAFIQIDVQITDNGTGAGAIQVSIPEAAVVSAFLAGRNITIGGKMLQGQVGATVVTVYNYDNTYPASSGSRLVLSGTYLTN